MRRLPSVPQLVVLVLGLWLGVAQTALAMLLPEIKAHSETEFSVYRGDKVVLEVQASGEGLEMKWLMNDIVCRKASCELDTSDWGLGVHPVTFVVFNAKGSLFVRFHIKVLVAPQAYQPGKVVPPLVAAGQGIEAVAAEDLTVRSVVGRGYSYHQHKLQVIGPLPRTLDWAEKLRTQAGSSLRFGRDGVEEHLLWERSEVYLTKADSGRRAIVLAAGTVRSRSLAPHEPRWSIVAGDWIQVDTDVQGDVVVVAEAGAATGDSESGDGDTEADDAKNRSVDAVTVTVLRGNARVFLRRTGESDGDDDGVAVTVPQGLALHVTRAGALAPHLALPDGEQVGLLVAKTSPQYLPGERPDPAAGTTLLGTKQAADADDALRLATEALQHRDSFVAIEALARFPAALKQSYKANLVLGEAYMGIFLYGPAARYLHAAAELRERAPAPHRLLGMLAMSQRDWGAAAAELSTAEALDDPNGQVVAYNLAVAQYLEGDRTSARSSFVRSRWDEDDADLAASARKFEQRLQRQTWLDLRFAGGVFYDSNVLRSAVDPKSVGPGLSTDKSAGLDGRAGFSLWPSHDGAMTAELAFDAEERQYLATSLKPLTMVDEGVALKLVFGAANPAGGAPPVTADLALFARTIGLGGQRAMDEIGGGVGLGAPALLGLRLGVETTLAVDPQPGRDFILDPVRWEVVPPGDRSLHWTTEDLRFEPLSGGSGHVAVELRAGDAGYRSVLEQDENFHDVGAGIMGRYLLNQRSTMDLGLKETARTFKRAADGRKDATLGLDFGWRYLLTPTLAQTLGVGVEAQKSTRAANTYKRELYSYGLNLAF